MPVLIFKRQTIVINLRNCIKQRVYGDSSVTMKFQGYLGIQKGIIMFPTVSLASC